MIDLLQERLEAVVAGVAEFDHPAPDRPPEGLPEERHQARERFEPAENLVEFGPDQTRVSFPHHSPDALPDVVRQAVRGRVRARGLQVRVLVHVLEAYRLGYEWVTLGGHEVDLVIEVPRFGRTHRRRPVPDDGPKGGERGLRPEAPEQGQGHPFVPHPGARAEGEQAWSRNSNGCPSRETGTVTS